MLFYLNLKQETSENEIEFIVELVFLFIKCLFLYLKLFEILSSLI